MFTRRPPARILANHKPRFLLPSLVFVFCLLLPMAAKAAALWARRRAGPRNSGGGSVFSINKVCFWLGWEEEGLKKVARSLGQKGEKSPSKGRPGRGEKSSFEHGQGGQLLTDIHHTFPHVWAT